MGKTFRNDGKHDQNANADKEINFPKKNQLKKFMSKKSKRELKEHFSLQHVWSIPNEKKKGPKI